MTATRSTAPGPPPPACCELYPQRHWAETPVRERLTVVRHFRHALAEQAQALAEAITTANPRRPDAAQTLAVELLPLAAAAGFLEQQAQKLLRPRRVGRRGRPAWLMGVRGEVRREPWGTVLILGPSNYPLLLPGVQVLQALTAGNAVILKPGRNGTVAARALADLLAAAGLPEGLLTLTGESEQAGTDAIGAGVDHVVLTGSDAAGQAVLARCAARLTPATLELGGCDAVWVGPNADLDLVTRLLVYGVRLNGGATCLGPHRVFVHRSRSARLETKLQQAFDAAEPVSVGPKTARRLSAAVDQAIQNGARGLTGTVVDDETVRPWVIADARPEMAVMLQDLFGPVLTLTVVSDEADFLTLNRRCPYRLGVAVFDGSDSLIDQCPAGSVTVGDLIVPTADPRLPFGGWDASGFGVTRGAEGLEAMTRVKVVTRRSGGFRPHADPRWADDPGLFVDYLQAAHGPHWIGRLWAGWRVVQRAAGKVKQA